MAFVDLTDVECQLAEPGMPDFGVLQKPVLGGPINKVDRLGGGHTLSYTVPPKMMEPDGRRLVARCQMAKRYGVVLEVPQEEFAVGTPGVGITRQGYLEQSNVNIIQQITDLISAQRAYEISSKMVSAVDEMLRNANQTL